MTPSNLASLRTHIVALLDGGQAFAKPSRILEDIPEHARGALVAGFDHTLWELVEHLRISQRDILDFCVAEVYREIAWPNDYWPRTKEPSSDGEWRASVATFLADLDEAKLLASDESTDLFAIVPHGTTQTWLRELLLIADHNAHHLGQIITVRKILGVW